MIDAAPALLGFMLISMLFTLWFAKTADRRFMMWLMFGGWSFLTALTVVANEWLPFTGGGDDESYLFLATGFGTTWHDIFDPIVFQGAMEQAGYPWLLNVINFIFEPGLLGFKLFNLLLLMLIALVWYRIGCELGDNTLARWMSAAVLLLTPLWFYVAFLLKDLAVVLAQSVFLLGLTMTWRRNSLQAWFIAAVGALAILPLRSPLLLQDMVIAAGTVTAHLLVAEGRGRRLLVLIIGMLAMLLLFLIASNPELMLRIGIFSEARVIGTEAMRETAQRYIDESQMSRILFPFLYLFSETSGLNRETWATLDASWLRGLLALPWIAFVPPMFLLGLYNLTGREHSRTRNPGIGETVLGMRMLATPWVVIVLFIAASMVVSWTVGDTTRWRLSDMPAMVAVALAAWRFGTIRQAINWLMLWLLVAGGLFGVYYLLKA